MYSYLFIVVFLLLEVYAGDGVGRRRGHVILAGRRGDGGDAGGGRTHGVGGARSGQDAADPHPAPLPTRAALLIVGSRRGSSPGLPGPS